MVARLLKRGPNLKSIIARQALALVEQGGGGSRSLEHTSLEEWTLRVGVKVAKTNDKYSMSNSLTGLQRKAVHFPCFRIIMGVFGVPIPPPFISQATGCQLFDFSPLASRVSKERWMMSQTAAVKTVVC
ncbi:hypothetical protein HNY73_002607 [Argiope bruennichi]|uniref:Uncharacterized protein n=1 Tax=Argiope bruennichi TaxID=94029 RepID=A0A8T0FU36_ARGBR|nr:hypothetical protein HNY73_002607 [Argiope bruennichi]